MANQLEKNEGVETKEMTLKEAAEVAAKTVKDTYYIDITGSLYCFDENFAKSVIETLESCGLVNFAYFPTDFLNYEFEVFEHDLPF